MSRDRRTFVLVHGSWCGGWVWAAVRDQLEAAGHRVFTPTLSGLADRSHLLGPGINLTTHVLDVANLIRWEGLEDIVLVGHSYGGMVISGVADRVGSETIRSIVYLDALYLADGERAAAAVDDMHRPRLIDVDGVRCLKPADAAAAFGLNGDLAKRVDSLLTPMPAAAFAERPVVQGARDQVARKTFILAEHCTMPFFRPIFGKLATAPGWAVRRMDANHLMMIEQPEETAQLLCEIA